MAMVCMVTVFYHFIFFKSDESINILYCVLRYHSAFFNYNDFYKFFSFFTVFYVILYSTYALLADVVSAMLPVVLFHENINQVLSGGGIRAVFTLVYLILLGVLIGLTAIPGKRFFHACDNFCLCVIPVYDYAVIYL